jgi:hypothetical protein
MIAIMALFTVVLPALADELIGTIKSVDVDAKKFVVTPKDGGDAVEVTSDEKTTYENAKGKVFKNFMLSRLKEGGKVEVTHEKGVASKVVLQKGAYKKKGE